MLRKDSSIDLSSPGTSPGTTPTAPSRKMIPPVSSLESLTEGVSPTVTPSASEVDLHAVASALSSPTSPGRSDTEQELLDRSDGESERRQPRDITNLVERRKYATKLFAQLMNVKQGKRPGDLLRDGVFRQQKDITMMAYIDGWRHMVDLCMSHGSLGYLRHLSEDRIKAMTQHYMSTFENTLLADQGEQRIPWYFTAKTVSDEEEVIMGGNFGEPDPFPGVFDEDVRSSLARSSLESRAHCVLETCTSPKLHTRSQIGLESKSDVEAAELDILSHMTYSGGDSTSDSESEDTGASKGVPSLSQVDRRLGPVDPIEGLLSGQVMLNVHERQQQQTPLDHPAWYSKSSRELMPS